MFLINYETRSGKVYQKLLKIKQVCAHLVHIKAKRILAILILLF